METFKTQINILAIIIFCIALILLISILLDVHSYSDIIDLLTFKYVDPRTAPFDKDAYSFLPLSYSLFFLSFALAMNGTWLSFNQLIVRVIVTLTLLLFSIFFIWFWLNGLKPAP